MGWDLQTLSELGSVIDRIEAAAETESLLEAMRVFMQTRGFEHIGIGPLLNPATLNAPISSFGATDFPEEYLQLWFDKNFIMIDPITRYGIAARNAFTWQNAYDRADKVGRRVLDTGRDFALDKGMAVPVAIPGMPTGLITLSHADPRFSQADIAAIEIVAIHAYTRLLDLVDAVPEAKPYILTARETEVMHYIAAGKTNWETSEILGVSEDTIKAHMKSIMLKTQSANRAHSVMKTMRAGDILP